MMIKSRFLKISFLFIVMILSFLLDRYYWMPERAKSLFLWEKGPILGDPISYGQSFHIKDSYLIFKDYEQKESWPERDKNRKSKLYFAGCYFGNLYIYDEIKKELIIYSKK